MSLYKRTKDGNYYCRFEISGQEIRRSTGTKNKAQAQAFEQRLREQAWQQQRLGKVDHTFDEACLQWLTERSGKRSLHSDKAIMRWLLERLSGELLSNINGSVIAKLRSEKSKTASKSTVNRHMALLRSILKACVDEWQWLDSHPKVPMYRIETPEPRWLTHEEFNRFVSHLPTHLNRAARFAVNTGLRSRPIRELKWSQVGEESLLVTVSQAKNAKAMSIPLNAGAQEVLAECRSDHPRLVFTNNGKPLRREMVDKPWRKAIELAEIDHVRFHDLRHTWASWHVQNGTPLEVIKELGGWSDLKMVLRYAHLAPTTLKKWAGNI